MFRVFYGLLLQDVIAIFWCDKEREVSITDTVRAKEVKRAQRNLRGPVDITIALED